MDTKQHIFSPINLEKLEEHHSLIRYIADIQRQYIDGVNMRELFDSILDMMLSYTKSEYGFIGEVLYDEQSNPYLKTYSITNIAWDEETQKFYDDYAATGMEFRNLDNLFGHTIKSTEKVITNSPKEDKHSGGTPSGHPAIKSYMGLPIFGSEGIVGMTGMANRSEGYDELIAQELSPLLQMMGSFIDAHSQRRELERRAHYDYLLELPNRAHFEQQLEATVKSAEQSRKMFALMYLDLDNFKEVNNSLGHQAGDTLLRAITQRLTTILHKQDFIARLGGDEFALILTKINNRQSAGVIAQKIIKDLNCKYTVEGKEFVVGASIGIACYPNAGKDIMTLQKSADLALFHSKETGRNKYTYFAATQPPLTELQKKELEEILKNEELYLCYQPQVDPTSNRIVGLESLIRWSHPFAGEQSPNALIPLAENSGEIIQINEWLFSEIVTDILPIIRDKDISLSINLSASQLENPEHLQKLTSSLVGVNFPPSRITLEITETAIIKNIAIASLAIRDLHRQGFKIAIDDFGTGNNTLNFLKQFPIDLIKISPDFIREIYTSSKSRAIVTFIVQLANSLGIQCVAEGVETQQQLEFLQGINCSVIQGFYFHKPLPASEVNNILQ